MRFILFLMIPFYLFGKSSFITPMEYASSLYKNPRGIGCHNCHGKKGEGKIIANFTHKNKKINFSGPAINSINFNIFYKALNGKKIGMPKYFLTKKEIQALYFYLQEQKQDKDK